MYQLKYYNKKLLLGKFDYPTLEQAQDAVYDNDIWNNSSKYKIIDLDTGDLEDEEEFETESDIMDSMFPDEDSKKGFDVDDFYDRD